MKIIVSLTTIPARIQHIQPVIDSILNQSVKPDSIDLFVPYQYNKRSLGVIDPGLLPEGVNIEWVENDLGPATKILPATLKYKGMQDLVIIYCDDDRIYDYNWIKRLTDIAKTDTNACVAESCFSVTYQLSRVAWRDKRPIAYRLLRTLSLGLFRPYQKMNDYCDIAEGFGGVLVRPHFFCPEAFDIPDILWTVDDIWLSGWLAINGHKILRTSGNNKGLSSDLISNGRSVGKITGLNRYVYRKHDRNLANEACIEYMQKNHRIWL
jgi:hypothetical protein